MKNVADMLHLVGEVFDVENRCKVLHVRYAMLWQSDINNEYVTVKKIGDYINTLR
jgi:hypothetical protein